MKSPGNPCQNYFLEKYPNHFSKKNTADSVQVKHKYYPGGGGHPHGSLT